MAAGWRAENAMTGHVVCFGELLLRLSTPDHRLMVQSDTLDMIVGGAEANVAAGLASLGHQVKMISRVADNPLGSKARATIASTGVNVSHLVSAPGRMGLYFLESGGGFRPSSIIYDRANSAFALAGVKDFDFEAALKGASLMHISGITPALGPGGVALARAAIEAARTAQVPICFDGNYRSALWTSWDSDPHAILAELMRSVTIMIGNHRDISLLVGKVFSGEGSGRRREAAEAAFAEFPNLQIIASTARHIVNSAHHRISARVDTRTNAHQTAELDVTGIVDRIGTGDAFAAGVLHRWLGNGDVVAMAEAGLAYMRYVETRVKSEAVLSGTPVAVKHKYDNYLPSLNLALDITKDLVARFSYGRSMTRPGLSSLNVAGPVFGYTTRTVSNIGNPFLKPYESNDVDLSLEWYTRNGGLLAIGFFNKDVVTSIKTRIVTQMIDPSYWPAIYADPQYNSSFNADPAAVPYTFTIPVNIDGNRVRGVEFTVNQPFTFLPGMLSYLGVAANYTHVSARDSTGLSPNSYNLTLYFDHKDYGLRVSANKRDDYLLLKDPGNGHAQERKYGPRHVDLSAYYNVNDHLTISFEGINITDEKELIYGTGQGDQHLFREYSHTGSQWFLGARYKF